ncbi:MAG: glycoside hydrolase family 43 protein [Pseudomonadota bacterium]
MKRLFAFALLGAAACSFADSPSTVRFNWFEYQGQDPIYAAPLAAGNFHNPILSGYYPDPSVVRVGDKYYLVNSTFAHWPGIPIHESDDLVHWKLIGHALSDAANVSFDGLGTSRGVFAPSIHFHRGTFYIINTLVDAGGNFFVTAKNPAGPWSAPVWLKEIDGIDPSFFFDDDGKTYIVNNGPPEGTPLYQGHRAIWMQEFDLAANKLTGQRKVIVNGGADLAKKPIWIEGPHLYRINGWYYLMCAEGGTERGHSEVIFRSKSPWGPFEPYKNNPILTQRDLAPGRANPVTNAGHADLVQMKDGSWWSVFLASRPYQDYRFNTGRETFLLPVTWKEGWPVILTQGKSIPTTLAAPTVRSPAAGSVYDALSGNFTKREEFDGALGPEWLQVHVPKETWFSLANGALQIHALTGKLSDRRNTSFLARRQQHTKFEASTELATPPAGVAAGLAAFQNENYWYFFGTKNLTSGPVVFLERSAGEVQNSKAVVVPRSDSLRLRISADGGKYSFYYDAGKGWQALLENDDGSILSTEVAGGFVGTVLGPFARQD